MVSPLFPVFVPAPISQAQEPADRILGKAFSWDFTTNDFVIDGNGRLIEIDDRDALVQWIVLALSIQRSAFPVYSNNFGMDIEHIIGIDTNIAEAETQMAIEDALVNSDERVYLVTDFEFDLSGTTLNVEFRVIPVEGEAILQTFSLEG